MTKIYTVFFTNQDREFVWSGRQLPLFDSLFGIYEDMSDAYHDVCNFLYNGFYKVEVTEEYYHSDEYGNTIGYSYTFKYKDPDTEAVGTYQLEIREGYITPKSSPSAKWYEHLDEEKFDMIRNVVIHPKEHTISVLK